MKLDKASILAALRERLTADLDALTASQAASQEGATLEEARPEGDKDTRATESSYLARGLAKRVTEMREEAQLVANLRLRVFGDGDPIALSALVTVEDQLGVLDHYFVAPAGGGLKIITGETTVGIVTQRSPLGSALVGKRCDDAVELRTPRGVRELTIVAVR